MTDRMWSEGTPLISSSSCGNTRLIAAIVIRAGRRKNGMDPFLLLKPSAEQFADRVLTRLDDADRPSLRREDLLCGIDAQDLADAGHEVLDADGAIDDLRPVGVGLADGLAALDTAAD